MEKTNEDKLQGKKNTFKRKQTWICFNGNMRKLLICVLSVLIMLGPPWTRQIGQICCNCILIFANLLNKYKLPGPFVKCHLLDFSNAISQCHTVRPCSYGNLF